MKPLLKNACNLIVLIGCLASFVRAAWGQSVTPVPKLDLNRYMGVWYEIARLPNKAEKQCISDSAVLYAPAYKRNHFYKVVSCQIKNNNSDARNSSGKMEKAGDGKLTLGFIWPFTTKHWVLALDPDYEWAIVGTPNHKSLWLLSRTATIQPELIATIEAAAVAQGFSMGKLVIVPQHH